MLPPAPVAFRFAVEIGGYFLYPGGDLSARLVQPRREAARMRGCIEQVIEI